MKHMQATSPFLALHGAYIVILLLKIMLSHVLDHYGVSSDHQVSKEFFPGRYLKIITS